MMTEQEQRAIEETAKEEVMNELFKELNTKLAMDLNYTWSIKKSRCSESIAFESENFAGKIPMIFNAWKKMVVTCGASSWCEEGWWMVLVYHYEEQDRGHNGTKIGEAIYNIESKKWTIELCKEAH